MGRDMDKERHKDCERDRDGDRIRTMQEQR